MRIIYGPGELTTNELRSAILLAIDQLRGEPDSVAELAEIGVTPDELAAGIEVQPAGSGMDPLTVALIVAFAPTVNHMLKTAWDRFVLRRVKKNEGSDAVGLEVQVEEDASGEDADDADDQS